MPSNSERQTDLTGLVHMDKIYDLISDYVVISKDDILEHFLFEGHRVDSYLNRMIEDKFLIEDSFITIDEKETIVFYSINHSQPYEGYQKTYEKKDKISWYESNKAERQYRDYPITKWLSISAFIISIAAIFLELLKWLSTQSSR